MPRSFAVSDIHGCSKTFIALIENTIRLEKQDHLYLLGDYIDRGPDSKGVIDFILHLKEEGFQVRTLMGNHEKMLLDAYSDRDKVRVWLMNGGEVAMESFKIDQLSDLPEKYIQFFKDLEYYILLDRYVLVHAGLNFNIPDPLSDKEAMLWLRKYTVNPELIGGRMLVHGHTPQPLFKIEEDVALANANHVIGIDAGCVFSTNDFYGHLCALQLDTMKAFFEKNIDSPGNLSKVISG
ncbi:MAG TPA: metallophosphoesterase family protein [Cytophagaceae bacterium]